MLLQKLFIFDCHLQIADGALFPQRDKQSRYGNITYLDELAAANPGEDFVAVRPVTLSQHSAV